MITLPWLLISGHPCQVHVIFVPILKRNSPQECAIPSPEPHNHCHFYYKIKSKTLLETWILDPIQGPEKGLMIWNSIKHQVLSLNYHLKQFVLVYQSQKSNFSHHFYSKFAVLIKNRRENVTFEWYVKPIRRWVLANPNNFTKYFSIWKQENIVSDLLYH